MDTIGLDYIFHTSWKELALVTVKSHYHLWFLPSLIGLYMLQPFIRAIISYKEEKYLPYFLALFFIFGVIRPTLLHFIQNPLGVTLIQKIPMDLMGYSAYMILGYYLANSSKFQCHPLILLGGYAISLAMHLFQPDGKLG